MSLERFGELLGEAFQLRDDLLGTFGDAVETGKPIDSDIREGKKNVLYAKTLTMLSGDDRRFFEAHWGGGADLSIDDCERVRSLVETSGARAETENLLEGLTAEALRSLDDMGLEPDAGAGLKSLVTAATSRTS